MLRDWEIELGSEFQRNRGKRDGTLSIERFAIIGLHGRQNIFLQFNSQHTIFIADNGAGKTTALYLLQAILTLEFSKATRFDFEEVKLTFSDGSKFRIRRQAILDRPFARKFMRFASQTDFSEKQIIWLAQKSRHSSPSQMRFDPEFRRLSQQTKYGSARLYDILRRWSVEVPENSDLFEAEDSDLGVFRSYIKDNFPHEIIYLPTYRRIEQDLSLLSDASFEDEEVFGSLIKFGMNDVKSRINEIGEEIRGHLARTYTSVSGQMLHQLTNPASLTDDMRQVSQDVSAIETVLARLSNVISGDDRQQIQSMAEKGEIANNHHLAFFLYNLIRSYHEFSESEYSLEFFAKIANKYLLNKRFRYDPANASLGLFEIRGGDALDLNVLSSGEKQLIGVLSQVYLAKSRSCLVIFDEPELSLSVEWQQNLLPDLAASPNCRGVIAATHSPFIFQNELDSSARTFDTEFLLLGPDNL